MDHYFGFDLGDAECAIACLPNDEKSEERLLKIRGEQSFIADKTAFNRDTHEIRQG